MRLKPLASGYRIRATVSAVVADLEIGRHRLHRRGDHQPADRHRQHREEQEIELRRAQHFRVSELEVVAPDIRLNSRRGDFVIGRRVHHHQAGQHNQGAVRDAGPQERIGIADGANQMIEQRD